MIAGAPVGPALPELPGAADPWADGEGPLMVDGMLVRGGAESMAFAWEQVAAVPGQLRSAAEAVSQVQDGAVRRLLAPPGLGPDAGSAAQWAAQRLEEALTELSRSAGRTAGEIEALARAVDTAYASYVRMEDDAIRAMYNGPRLPALPLAGLLVLTSVSGRGVERMLGQWSGLGRWLGPGLAAGGFRERQRPVVVEGDPERVEGPGMDPGAGVASYLVGGLDAVKRHAVPREGSDGSSILVERIRRPGEPDTFVVYLPGSADLTHVGSQNPNGILGVADALYGQSEAMRSGVEAALEGAEFSPGDRLVLAGHSQGGMHAANLAADPAFASRWNVRGLFTVGAPTGLAEPQPGVAALQIENSGDAVPGLEGVRNRATAERVTVTVPYERPDVANLAAGGFPVEHALTAYAESVKGVDRAEGRPGIASAARPLGDLLGAGGSGVTRDYLAFGVRQDAAAPPPHTSWQWGGDRGRR